MKKTSKKFIELREELEIYDNILKSMETITGVHRNFFCFHRSRRSTEIMLRYILIHFLRKYIRSWTLEQIAWKVGMGDHSSVIHSLKRVDEWQSTGLMFSEEVNFVNQIQEHYENRNTSSTEVPA